MNGNRIAVRLAGKRKAQAQQAARRDDNEILRETMLETLRVNSFCPGVFRQATEDYVIAKGTFRSKKNH